MILEKKNDTWFSEFSIIVAFWIVPLERGSDQVVSKPCWVDHMVRHRPDNNPAH